MSAARLALPAIVLWILSTPGRCLGQAAGETQGALEFRGFTAGAPLAAIRATLQHLDGRPLRCTTSTADSTVQECRGSFPDGPGAHPVEVWLSAIEGHAGVLSLKASAHPDQLEAWRSELQSRFGQVPTRIQGSQRMMQWVRQGRMIRLTWRGDSSGPAMSVSLVDGRILDAWGARRQP